MTDETPRPDDQRTKLDDLAARKEAAFARKAEVGSRIQERIQQIGDYRKRRNDLTTQVRDLKKQRDELNTQITARIAEIKAQRPAKPEHVAPKRLVDEKGRPITPRDLQRKIVLLEERLETVPMDFAAEQRATKQLKAMKKQFADIEHAHGLSTDLAEKSREIDRLKREANALHAKVTKLARESQEYHERMLALSAEIEALKKDEEAAYQEFLARKQEFLALAGDVKEQQVEARAQRETQRAQERQERKRKDAEDQKTLQQRAQEAEEKMVRGEKLTTEDLLAMQSVKD